MDFKKNKVKEPDDGQVSYLHTELRQRTDGILAMEQNVDVTNTDKKYF